MDTVSLFDAETHHSARHLRGDTIVGSVKLPLDGGLVLGKAQPDDDTGDSQRQKNDGCQQHFVVKKNLSNMPLLHISLFTNANFNI